MVAAHEQNGLALERKERGDNQYRRGVELLEQVRWDELDENSRRAHEGTLLVLSAIIGNQDQANRRQDAIEKALAGVINRLDQVERPELAKD